MLAAQSVGDGPGIFRSSVYGTVKTLPSGCFINHCWFSSQSLTYLEKLLGQSHSFPYIWMIGVFFKPHLLDDRWHVEVHLLLFDLYILKYSVHICCLILLWPIYLSLSARQTLHKHNMRPDSTVWFLYFRFLLDDSSKRGCFVRGLIIIVPIVTVGWLMGLYLLGKSLFSVCGKRLEPVFPLTHCMWSLHAHKPFK